MVLLSQAAKESSKTFVMGLFQPFPEFMVGGAEELLLGKLKFVLNTLEEVCRIRVSTKDPLEQSFLKAVAIQVLGSML